MKSLGYITLLYLCLALLATSCTKSAPVPACVAAEVVSQDCESGWYILKLEDDSEEVSSKSGSYVGQLHGGYVTTDKLPELYRQPGLRVNLRLELNTAYGPLCVTSFMRYPVVRVIEVCSAPSST